VVRPNLPAKESPSSAAAISTAPPSTTTRRAEGDFAQQEPSVFIDSVGVAFPPMRIGLTSKMISRYIFIPQCGVTVSCGATPAEKPLIGAIAADQNLDGRLYISCIGRGILYSN
jgi:hypothetical protein